MERGDIYLAGLDPTAGHEQQGRRPVLIVSPGAFNRVTKAPVVVPVTSGGSFARTAGFAVCRRRDPDRDGATAACEVRSRLKPLSPGPGLTLVGWGQGQDASSNPSLAALSGGSRPELAARSRLA